MYRAAGELPALILSISSFVILVFTEISTGVQTIFFHGARNTMRAASGSNQRLNSWRGGFSESGLAGFGVQAGPLKNQFFCRPRKFGGVWKPNTQIFVGPPPQI